MIPTEILDTVKEIQEKVKIDKEQGLDENETKYRLTEEYSDFSMKYPVIFLKSLDGGLDMDQFQFMINMATKVNNKKLSQHDASVQIGEKLVNQYVKPNLDLNKVNGKAKAKH